MCFTSAVIAVPLPSCVMRHDDIAAARVAVSALFFVNGAMFANWVPRIPDVKLGLGLTDGALGLAILGTGAGALLGSLAAGPLATRWGSRGVATTAGVALGALLVLPGIAASWLALALSLLVLGVCDSTMDVAMNADALLVQDGYGRSIVNTFHGLWSIGAVAGSLAGSLAAARQIPVALHLMSAGLALAVVVVVARRWLLPSPPPDAAVGATRGTRAERARRRGLVLPTGAVGALGVIAVLGAVVEDSPGSWSAVYLRESLGARPGVAGLAFAAFTAAMTVGRLLGDRVTERFGTVRVLRLGTLLGGCGLAVGLLSSSPAVAIAGFGLAGAGVSTLFPFVFAAAGTLPGVPPGGGIGMVSLLARCGFLIAPPTIGLIADASSLRLALGVVVCACGAITLLAGRLNRRVVAAR